MTEDRKQVKEALKRELFEKTVRELHVLARKYRIPYYGRKTKQRLVEEIATCILQDPDQDVVWKKLLGSGVSRSAEVGQVPDSLFRASGSVSEKSELSGGSSGSVPSSLLGGVYQVLKPRRARTSEAVASTGSGLPTNVGQALREQLRALPESALQDFARRVNARVSAQSKDALIGALLQEVQRKPGTLKMLQEWVTRWLKEKEAQAARRVQEAARSMRTSVASAESDAQLEAEEDVKARDKEPVVAQPVDLRHPLSDEVVERVLQELDERVWAEGVLKVLSDGYGIIRSSDYNYLSSPDDIFVSPKLIKRYGLKTGDTIRCTIRVPRSGERMYTAGRLLLVNGLDPEVARHRTPFEYLTPLFPNRPFRLAVEPTDYDMRIVELFAPIGRGQRGLIVAQPTTGKTTLLKRIARGITTHHPEVYVIVLLINERPEEVTDWRRSVRAEVIASTFDNPAEKHVEIAELVLEKAKRMVECGHHVVILLDSLTRLARAYNDLAPASGKILSGGVESSALNPPKQFFGAARNIENGGSLTIIATALIDTGSRMDEVIFEEFKGTGNMEIQLDRKLANRRIFPAIDLLASGTRREELLLEKWTLQRVWVLRNQLASFGTAEERLRFVLENMRGTPSNREFLLAMNQ